MPKDSINKELVEEFVDCTVRIQTPRGRVQGTLHGVSRVDQGLVLVVGITGTNQYESVEEETIELLEGESVEGFVQLYPFEETEEDPADDESGGEDEDPDAQLKAPANGCLDPGHAGAICYPNGPDAGHVAPAEPVNSPPSPDTDDSAGAPAEPYPDSNEKLETVEVGDDLTPQEEAAATRKLKKAEAEAMATTSPGAGG